MSKATPTIDQYTQLKNDLAQKILKKQQLDLQLQELEDSIYDKEAEYFNESTYGNIIKGFDNFAKTLSSSFKRKLAYTDEDHVFSMSSATFVRTLQKRQGTGQPDYDDFEDSIEPPASSQNGQKEQSTPGRKRKSRTEEPGK